MKRAIVLFCISMLAFVIINSIFVYSVYAGRPQPPSGQTLPWGVDRIDADKAWGTTKGAGVKIAILDTGVEKTHPDLVGKTAGVNFLGVEYPGDQNYDDHHGHGTAIAGIISANDNNIGVVGVAPEATIYTVKIREDLGIYPDNYPNHNGIYNFTDLCEGMQWCIENHVQIINFSLGIGTIKYDQNGSLAWNHYLHDSGFYYWVRQAAAQNIIMIAAAGNASREIQKFNDPPLDADYEDINDIYMFPASYPEMIAVSATGLKTVGKKVTDFFATFSNYGPAVELSAPGASIYTTYLNGSYGTGGGTSYSAPHVVGVAALLLSNGVPANEVRAMLQSTAEHLSTSVPDPYYGYGLVDAGYAIVGQRAPARPNFAKGKISVTWGELKSK